MKYGTKAIASGLACAVAAFGVAACGSSKKSSSTSSSAASSSSSGGGTVDVYSSLPLQGASKDQTGAMVQGMQLALSQAKDKAGSVTVKYTPLDDSTAQAGNWDPAATQSDARQVVQDPKAVAYIGEFNSGASALSIPIINRAGIAQISPANTYVGLTTNEPGSAPGEPDKYYPTGKRTYMRIVPRDTIQAAALLTLMKSDGCTKVAVANDKDTYGAGLAKLLDLQAPKVGVTIASDTGIQKDAANFRAYAAKIKSQGADCFVFSGVTANGAVQITKDVASALPNAKIYGPDGDCESAYTNPKKGGIPASLASRVQCTVATLNLTSYPGGRDFLTAFKAKYNNPEPDPYAIYGYASMKLVLDTLTKLGDKATDKSAVLAALLATKNYSSALGTFSFDKNGDTTLTDYGVYKVGPDGNPAFEKAIKSKS